MVPAMDDKTETQAKAGAMIVPVTLFEQNCTIIWHEPSKKAVVIDPGGDVDKIQAAIKQTGVTVEKIWLTHGHIDHAHTMMAPSRMCITCPRFEELSKLICGATTPAHRFSPQKTRLKTSAKHGTE